MDLSVCHINILLASDLIIIKQPIYTVRHVMLVNCTKRGGKNPSTCNIKLSNLMATPLGGFKLFFSASSSGCVCVMNPVLLDVVFSCFFFFCFTNRSQRASSPQFQPSFFPAVFSTSTRWILRSSQAK